MEVKGFGEPEDVLKFFRKLQFAQRQLDGPFHRLMIAPFAQKRAVQLAQEIGIRMLLAEAEQEEQPEASGSA